MKSFKNARVYIAGKGIVRTDISFDAVVRAIGRADGEEIPLPDGALVAPAFIDEHIHGAGGCDAMDGSVTALSVVANALAREGTARFLATTMTQSKANTLAALAAVKAYRERSRKDGAAIMGVHLEGPFVSSSRAGAQPKEYIVKPNIALFDEFYKASGGCVKLLTLAPEQDGALDLIRHAAHGVVCSVGHTDAKYDEVLRAAEVGATCVTHTFNAQSPFTHREAGTVGAALMTDALFTELIADGIHVSLPAIELLIKNKPTGKIVLITDSIRAKGEKDGESELGGQKVFVRSGEARLADGTLAGSVLKMNDAVKLMVERAGLSVERAIDCATINPATNLGVADKYGSIAVGKAADFVVLSEKFEVIMTIRDGEVIFNA